MQSWSGDEAELKQLRAKLLQDGVVGVVDSFEHLTVQHVRCTYCTLCTKTTGA